MTEMSYEIRFKMADMSRVYLYPRWHGLQLTRASARADSASLDWRSIFSMFVGLTGGRAPGRTNPRVVGVAPNLCGEVSLDVPVLRGIPDRFLPAARPT